MNEMNEKNTEMRESMNHLQKIVYGWIVIKKFNEDLENYAKLKSQYDL